MFVKSWKFFPVFAQAKEFVIKLLKILKWVNCNVQATASLGVARRLLEKKKSVLRKVFWGFTVCKIGKKINIFFGGLPVVRKKNDEKKIF